MNKMWIGKYVKIHEEYFKTSAQSLIWSDKGNNEGHF